MPNPAMHNSCQGEKPASLWDRRNPIVFLTGIFFFNMISRLGMAPVLPGIEMDLGIRHAQATGFFFLISTGYCAGLFGSIFLTPRFTHHHLIVFSGLSVGISLIVSAVSPDLMTLRISMLFLGLAGGFYLPSGVASLTACADKKNWGKVLGFHQLAPNLAYIGAPLIAELILPRYSWRAVLLVYGTATLAVTLSYYKWGKGVLERTDPPELKPLKKMLLSPSILIVTFLFVMAMGLNQGVFAVMPLYLTFERGFDSGSTNFLLALSRTVAFGFPLAGGWLADRFGVRKIILITMIFSISGTFMLALFPNSWMWAALITQASSSVCIFPLCFAVLSMVTTPQNRAVAVSVVVPTAHFSGAGLVPLGVGFLAEAGLFNLGFIGIGIITLLCIPFINYLWLSN